MNCRSNRVSEGEIIKCKFCEKLVQPLTTAAAKSNFKANSKTDKSYVKEMTTKWRQLGTLLVHGDTFFYNFK